MSRAAVFSAGSWGTAFAQVLSDAGTDTILHARRTEVADSINSTHENPGYLPGIRLPDSLKATTDPSEALSEADYVVLSIPAQSLRDNLRQWSNLIPSDAVIISLMKGIESDTGNRMSQVISQTTGIPLKQILVLSGPNLASEIAYRQPAASVISGEDEDVTTGFQNACFTPYFRPYTNRDVVGSELGGAIKNVIALAVGVATGMGLGDNSKAVLMTRGLAETQRLGDALGANPHTFSGMAGLGDLIATCSSPLSRNRTFGELLGKRLSVSEASSAATQTTEGVKSSDAILELARKHGVEMPITEVVVSLLRGSISLDEAMTRLMSRTPKSEHYMS